MERRRYERARVNCRVREKGTWVLIMREDSIGNGEPDIMRVIG